MDNIIEIDQKVSQKAESFAEREYSCGYEEREALNKGFYWGYKNAEKDIWAAIEKYLSKRDRSDYATVGWILKHLDEYKKAIMEE